MADLIFTQDDERNRGLGPINQEQPMGPVSSEPSQTVIAGETGVQDVTGVTGPEVRADANGGIAGATGPAWTREAVLGKMKELGVTDDQIGQWFSAPNTSVEKGTVNAVADNQNNPQSQIAPGLNPQNALAATYLKLMEKWTASGGKVRMSYNTFGAPVPGRAADRARFIQEQQARTFTKDDAQALAAVSHALGLGNQMAGVLGRMGVRSPYSFTAKGEKSKGAVEKTREAVPDYNRWGGKENYEFAQKMNAFYKANKEQWGDILSAISDGSVTLDDWGAMDRQQKQQILAMVHQRATAGDGDHSGYYGNLESSGKIKNLDLVYIDDFLRKQPDGFVAFRNDETYPEWSKSVVADWGSARAAVSDWNAKFKPQEDRFVGPVKPGGAPRVATGKYAQTGPTGPTGAV